jgi:hypothetical protein
MMKNTTNTFSDLHTGHCRLALNSGIFALQLGTQMHELHLKNFSFLVVKDAFAVELANAQYLEDQ